MCFPCPTFYQETIRKHCTDGPSTAWNEKFVAAITLLLFPDFQGLDLINPKGNLGEEVKLTGILSFKKTIFKEQLKKKLKNVSGDINYQCRKIPCGIPTHAIFQELSCPS